MLTVISESVAPMHGGKGDTRANLENYRAEYYGAIAMVAIGLVVSFFFFFCLIRSRRSSSRRTRTRKQKTKGMKSVLTVRRKKKKKKRNHPAAMKPAPIGESEEDATEPKKPDNETVESGSGNGSSSSTESNKKDK